MEKVYKRQFRLVSAELDVVPMALIISAITTLMIETGVVLIMALKRRYIRRMLLVVIGLMLIISTLWRAVVKTPEEKAFSEGDYQLEEYAIKYRDTLWDISVAHYKDFGLRDPRDYLCTLRKVNPGLTDHTILQVGQVINIPVPINENQTDYADYGCD